MNCSSVWSSSIHFHFLAFCWFLFATKNLHIFPSQLFFHHNFVHIYSHVLFSLFYFHFLYIKNSIFHEIVLLHEIGETSIKLHFTKLFNFLSF
jgi:hypothetical protein